MTALITLLSILVVVFGLAVLFAFSIVFALLEAIRDGDFCDIHCPYCVTPSEEESHD